MNKNISSAIVNLMDAGVSLMEYIAENEKETDVSIRAKDALIEIQEALKSLKFILDDGNVADDENAKKTTDDFESKYDVTFEEFYRDIQAIKNRKTFHVVDK